RLGGAKVPHLMPGDSLNLQTAQDMAPGSAIAGSSLSACCLSDGTPLVASGNVGETRLPGTWRACGPMLWTSSP
ncbi:hypothetical protein ACGLDU_005094, partial [Escherichia coli]